MVFVPKINQELARELVENANKIAAPGKGILATDESTGTIQKRFDSVGVENTEENRALYRSSLFKTKGCGEHISGAILFEETLYQKAPCGTPMVDLLKAENILPGIKVDKGLAPLFLADGESATQGLDGLGKRCAEYYKAGARFAKWRNVLSIGENKPSAQCIQLTATTLAQYAAICQENGIVPIVEPEILADGDHDIERCAYETERTLSALFKALNDHHVLLEGCLLKPNMVTPGVDCPTKATPGDVAYYTVRALQRTVPPALPGVMFLSGGQSEEDASLNLSAMNKLETKRPWTLSFSYGRALQASALKAFGANKSDADGIQKVFMTRAATNGAASLGKFEGSGDASAKESLFVKNYIY
eukprot:GEMP01042130.1.p1 GENE.GEMP01042130.1~~GEMP01042130.1.p1  ORF type:complete len:371 (+),score=103.94 GEMP01042130.1:32-1114(+)